MADDKDVAEKTIAEDLVVTKYKMAGDIVNSESHLDHNYIRFPFNKVTSQFPPSRKWAIWPLHMWPNQKYS